MCGCTATFICSRCSGTPQDWRWHMDESPRELEEQERDRDRYTEAPGKPWSERER